MGSQASAAVPCGLIHDLLPAAVGGELEPDTEAVLERHVKQCLKCAREWQALRESRQALRTLAAGAEADPGFDDAFFADLHAGIVGELERQSRLVHDAERLRAGQRRRPRRAAGWSWLSMVGALAATLLVGFLVGKLMDTYGRQGPVVVPSMSSTFAEQHVNLDLIADPSFEPYLMDAIRRFFERKVAALRVDPAVGVVSPVAERDY
jgi:hypothetical protein